MKYSKAKMISAAAAVFLCSGALAAKDAASEASSAKGECYGVVGKGEGDCGGKDPATGKSWSCAGNNPTADLGFKEMTKAECDTAPKHKDAKAKRFVAAK